MNNLDTMQTIKIFFTMTKVSVTTNTTYYENLMYYYENKPFTNNNNNRNLVDTCTLYVCMYLVACVLIYNINRIDVCSNFFTIVLVT